MANTWGVNRTGYDKQLFEIGTRLQNIESLDSLREITYDLAKIQAKMEKARAKKLLEELTA